MAYADPNDFETVAGGATAVADPGDFEVVAAQANPDDFEAVAEPEVMPEGPLGMLPQFQYPQTSPIVVSGEQQLSQQQREQVLRFGETIDPITGAVAGLGAGMEAAPAGLRSLFDYAGYAFFNQVDPIIGTKYAQELYAPRLAASGAKVSENMAFAKEAGGLGGEIAATIGQQLPMLPLQLATGGGAAAAGSAATAAARAVSASAALGGLQSASQSFSTNVANRVQQGETMEAATEAEFIPSIASGLITAAVTKGFGATGIESVFRSEGAKAAVNRVVGALKAGGMEIAEEVTDEAAQIVNDLVNNKGVTPEDAVKRVGMAAVAAGVLGTGVAGLHAQMQGLAEQPSKQPAAEPGAAPPIFQEAPREPLPYAPEDLEALILSRDRLSVLDDRLTPEQQAQRQAIVDAAQQTLSAADPVAVAEATARVAAQRARTSQAQPQGQAEPAPPAAAPVTPPAETTLFQQLREKEQVPTEKVVASAVLGKDGKIYTGTTHADAINSMGDMPPEFDDSSGEGWGFVTNAGRFLSREEAREFSTRESAPFWKDYETTHREQDGGLSLPSQLPQSAFELPSATPSPIPVEAPAVPAPKAIVTGQPVNADTAAATLMAHRDDAVAAARRAGATDPELAADTALTELTDQVVAGTVKLDNPGALLARTAVNKARDQQRPAAAQRTEPLTPDTPTGATTETPATAAISEERFNAIEQAVATLPEQDQTIINMTAENFSDAEIAEATGLKEEAVRKQRFRVREKLKDILKRELGPGAANVEEVLASYEQRKFGRRLTEDESLEPGVREGVSTWYEPKPMQESAADARAMIEQRGEGWAMNAMEDTIIPEDVRVTIGQVMIRRFNERARIAREAGDTAAENAALDSAIDVADKTAAVGTALGRGINMFKAWAALGPEGILRSYRRAVEKGQAPAKKKHGKAVKDVVDAAQAEAQVNTAAKAKKAEKKAEDRFQKVSDRIAEQLSDTPTWRGKKPPDEAMALIRAHLREPQENFQERLVAFGAKEETAAEIDRMAADNRRRIELERTVWNLGKNEREADKLADRLASELSDTPAWGKKQDSEVAGLIREHTKTPVDDFVGKLTKLGVSKETAASIDRMAAENRRRISVVDRAKRVDALRKRLIDGKNTVAKQLKKSTFERILELADNGLLTDEAVWTAVAADLKLPAFNPDFARKLYTDAQEAVKKPEGFQQDQAVSDVMDAIQKELGFTAAEAYVSYRYMNILSGLGTQEVNLLAALTQVLANTGVRSARFFGQGRPTEAGAVWRSLRTGLSRGIPQARHVLKTGQRLFSTEQAKARGFFELNKLGEKGGVNLRQTSNFNRVAKWLLEQKAAKPLGALKWVGRVMTAADTLNFAGAKEVGLFSAAAEVSREKGLTGKALLSDVAEQLHRNSAEWDAAMTQAASEGLTGSEQKFRAIEIEEQATAPDIRAEGIRTGLEWTYNNRPRGMVGSVANTIDAWAAQGDAAKVAKAVVVPFTRTVANVFNEWLNWTPYGYKRAAFDHFLSNKKDPLSATDRAELTIKASLGLAATGALLAAVKAGLMELNGGGPDDKEKRKQWIEAGNKPYAIRFKTGEGFTPWITTTTTPVSMQFAILGNYLDWEKFRKGDKKEGLERLGYAIGMAPGAIADQSFLNQTMRILEAMGRGRTQGANAYKNILAGETRALVPYGSLLKDVNNVFDQRQVDRSTLTGAALDGIPFAVAMGAKPALNRWGEPLQVSRNRFWSFPKADKLTQLLEKKRVFVPGMDMDVLIVPRNGRERPMTAEERYEYVRRSGKELRRQLEGRISEGMSAEGIQDTVRATAEGIRRSERARLGAVARD